MAVIGVIDQLNLLSLRIISGVQGDFMHTRNLDIIQSTVQP